MIPVLGDVTNIPTKRGLLTHSAKRSNAYELHDGAAVVSKRICMNIGLAQNEFGRGTMGNETCPPLDRNRMNSFSSQCFAKADPSKNVSMPEEVNAKGMWNLASHSQLSEGSGYHRDAQGDICCTSSASLATLKQVSDDKASCKSILRDADIVADGSSALTSTGTKCGIDQLEMPLFPGRKSFELNRCTGLQGNLGGNKNAISDMKKPCNCSFCLKAAYILSDLHYQDMKGRLTALKKSQKEAGIYVSKYAKEKHTQTPNLGDSSSSKLEADLLHQWIFLFQRMEDLFSHETLQLQSKFMELKGLRDECKNQLERTTGPQ